MLKGVRHNGVTVSVQDWSPRKKLPVLVVNVDGDNTSYKVASFKDKTTADWFCDVMEEFFKGLTEENRDGVDKTVP